MSGLSRREILLGAVAIAPFCSAETAWATGTALPGRILAASDLLSQESAAGYRRLLNPDANTIVVIGNIPVPPGMKARVRRGAILIRELPVSNFSASSHVYVRYEWPAATLVRHFGHSRSLAEWHGQPIAYFADAPVAWLRRYGQGAIVTLASMLGPHLLSGDREALQLATQIVNFKS